MGGLRTLGITSSIARPPHLDTRSGRETTNCVTPSRFGFRCKLNCTKCLADIDRCLNSAFLDISQHFTGHLFSPWIPSSAPGIDVVLRGSSLVPMIRKGGPSTLGAVRLPRTYGVRE